MIDWTKIYSEFPEIIPGPIIQFDDYKLHSNTRRGDRWICGHCGISEEEDLPISFYGPGILKIDWEITLHLECAKVIGAMDFLK